MQAAEGHLLAAAPDRRRARAAGSWACLSLAPALGPAGCAPGARACSRGAKGEHVSSLGSWLPAGCFYGETQS